MFPFIFRMQNLHYQAHLQARGRVYQALVIYDARRAAGFSVADAGTDLFEVSDSLVSACRSSVAQTEIDFLQQVLVRLPRTSDRFTFQDFLLCRVYGIAVLGRRERLAAGELSEFSNMVYILNPYILGPHI